MTTDELLIVDDLVLLLPDDDGASGQDPLQSGSDGPLHDDQP